MPNPDRPWSVPVRLGDVPEDGLVMSLTADSPVREAIARRGGLTGLPRLEARFAVTRRGSGLHVGGTVSATAGQVCVVTLEPMESAIEEEVDLLFTPDAPEEEPGPARDPEAEDPPERLVDGTVDLGAIATEFVLLGIDPYPRKPGVSFEPVETGPRDPGPFAALAALKEKGGAGGGGDGGG
ncbi:YceD family protein [Rhodoplanes sp. SY1]|uniref:YceD family protein n=1 Tax=Rhodoplanes sp. SY1 TaxID=3166646 RepID=UPI0038B4FC76